MRSYTCFESPVSAFVLQTSKMKVVAMLDADFYDLSLRKPMDAARFFSLVNLSSFSSTCD